MKLDKLGFHIPAHFSDESQPLRKEIFKKLSDIPFVPIAVPFEAFKKRAEDVFVIIREVSRGEQKVDHLS